jgi:APA family basic amino acid/polyamine antiporter
VAGSFDEIMAYFVFVVVLFVALSVAALFKFRRDDANGVRFLTPGYPVTPIFFLFMIALTLFLLGAGKPRQALYGVLVTALGFPVYRFLFRRKRLVERRTTQ